MKAKPLEQDVKNLDWKPAQGRAHEYLQDVAHLEFLNKWQKVSTKVSEEIGQKSRNDFSSSGVCSVQYPCDTITNASTAKLKKDAKFPGKKLKPIDIKKMDAFLTKVSKTEKIKLNHPIQKGLVFAGEVHHASVVARLTEVKKKEISGEHAAGLIFDAYKLIILKRKPLGIRAVVAQTNGSPKVMRAVCLFPKGSDAAQADNFCRGNDVTKEDEGEDKEDKEDDGKGDKSDEGDDNGDDTKSKKKGKKGKKGGDDDDNDDDKKSKKNSKKKGKENDEDEGEEGGKKSKKKGGKKGRKKGAEESKEEDGSEDQKGGKKHKKHKHRHQANEDQDDQESAATNLGNKERHGRHRNHHHSHHHSESSDGDFSQHHSNEDNSQNRHFGEDSQTGTNNREAGANQENHDEHAHDNADQEAKNGESPNLSQRSTSDYTFDSTNLLDRSNVDSPNFGSMRNRPIYYPREAEAEALRRREAQIQQAKINLALRRRGLGHLIREPVEDVARRSIYEQVPMMPRAEVEEWPVFVQRSSAEEEIFFSPRADMVDEHDPLTDRSKHEQEEIPLSPRADMETETIELLSRVVEDRIPLSSRDAQIQQGVAAGTAMAEFDAASGGGGAEGDPGDIVEAAKRFAEVLEKRWAESTPEFQGCE